MEIKNTITTKEGKMFDILYRDDDPESELKGKTVQGVLALCFYGDKLVVVYNPKTKGWDIPGGSIEVDETYEQATVREVKEESNMNVLFQKYIGCNTYTTEDRKEIRHTYSFCIIEPYGDFVSDPDGDISKIELIDPKDIAKYLEGWEIIGNEIMKKALEIKSQYLSV